MGHPHEQSGAFVAAMENVLDLYCKPYDECPPPGLPGRDAQAAHRGPFWIIGTVLFGMVRMSVHAFPLLKSSAENKQCSVLTESRAINKESHLRSTTVNFVSA